MQNLHVNDILLFGLCIYNSATILHVCVLLFMSKEMLLGASPWRLITWRTPLFLWHHDSMTADSMKDESCAYAFLNLSPARKKKLVQGIGSETRKNTIHHLPHSNLLRGLRKSAIEPVLLLQTGPICHIAIFYLSGSNVFVILLFRLPCSHVSCYLMRDHRPHNIARLFMNQCHTGGRRSEHSHNKKKWTPFFLLKSVLISRGLYGNITSTYQGKCCICHVSAIFFSHFAF